MNQPSDQTLARHRLTILGCASSPGVPRMGGPTGRDWGVCDPNNPKNARRRASALLERFGADGARTVVVIDTGPDFREQMMDAQLDWVDGVVYTHAHADHIHGIDDLRAFVHNRQRRVDVYCDVPTAIRLHEGFGYCFKTPPGSAYPPILNEHRIEAGRAFSIDGPGGPLRLKPILQQHGDITSLGFKVGNIAYSSDINGVPEASIPEFANLDLWVIDALRPKPHISHFSVAEALEWLHQMGAKRGILTHMHVDLDYAQLKADLPSHVEPAYDGLAIEFFA